MQHCNEFLPLLSGHLDGVNSEKEEARLLAHLKQCRHCRTLLEQMEATDAALRDDASEPPVDLTARIMEQVHREPRKRRFGKRFFAVSAAGLAAAAMLALVLNGKIPLISLQLKSAELAEHAAFKADVQADAQADVPDLSVTDEVLDGPKESLTWERNSDDTAENDTVTAETATVAPTVEDTQPVSYGNASDTPNEEAQPSAAEPTEAETPPTEPCTSAPTTPCSEAAPSEEAPTFSAPQPPTEPVDNGAANGFVPDSSPKRNNRRLLADYSDVQQYYPTLVIWNATVDCLDGISGLAQNIPDSSVRAPSENMQKAQDAQDNDRTLGKRFFSALPPIGVGVESTTLPRFVVSSYTTGSSVMESLLARFKGTYELALYYPEQLPQQDICTVLLVTVIPPSDDTQNAETRISENPAANNVISNTRNTGVSLPSVPNPPVTD